MAKDLMGPAAFGALNPATARPASAPSNSDGALDTWFKDCTSLTGRDGTAIVAGFMNFLLAQVRRAIRGMEIDESNLDDDMLLKAIQAASTGGAFPAHTHPQSQVINLVADLAGKVAKAGDTMTGDLNIAGSGVLGLWNLSGLRSYRLWAKPAGYLAITDETDAQERLVVDPSGGIGIGVSDPTARYGYGARLAVKKDQAADTCVLIENASTGGAVKGSLKIVTGSANSFYWQSLYDGDKAVEVVGPGCAAGKAVLANNHALLNSSGTSLFEVSNAGAIKVNGQFGTSNSVLTSQAGNANTWTLPGDILPRVVYQWQLATNTLYGTLGGNWTLVPLNTLTKNAISGASASAGTVTLPAGNYRAVVSMVQTIAASPSNVGPLEQFRLQNVTDGTTLFSAAFAGDGRNIPYEFTLSGAKNVQLQAFASSTFNNYTVLALSPNTPIATLTLEKIG